MMHSTSTEVMPHVEVKSHSLSDFYNTFQFSVSFLARSAPSKALQYVLHPQTHLDLNAFLFFSVMRLLFLFCIS